MAKMDSTSHELFATAEEIHVSSQRADGTMSTPITIWCVVVDGNVFARSVGGETSWFRALRNRGVGEVSVAGTTFSVHYDTDQQAANDAVDAAYLSKYARYPSIVPSCLTDKARATTFRIDPAT